MTNLMTPSPPVLHQDTTISRGNDLSTKYKDQWVMIGNIPMKYDSHLYQVSMEVTHESAQLYGREADWKQAIKLKLADKVADMLVEQMAFTQIESLSYNDMLTIYGRVFVFTEEEMSKVLESSTQLLTNQAP